MEVRKQEVRKYQTLAHDRKKEIKRKTERFKWMMEDRISDNKREIRSEDWKILTGIE